MRVAQDRWSRATPGLGKPRVYIQQLLELKFPEADYLRITQELGLVKPWDEDAAITVMEQYLEDLNDGSQCDSVHIEHRDGIVNLMTVVSHPYRQATFDRLMAAYTVRKAITPTAE